MPKFVKKPIEVEAIQLRWDTWGDVCTFIAERNGVNPKNFAYHITAEEASDTCGESGTLFLAFVVTTTHGESAIVRHGDWIIPDSKPGTFYPCKPDVFEATYNAIGEGESKNER